MSKPSQCTAVSVMILIQVLFGIHFIASKILVTFFPPLLWASARALVSAALLFLITLFLRRPHPKGGLSFFLPMFIFSLLGIIINQACFLVGLRYTSAINGAVLNTLIPVFTLLIVTIAGIETISLKRVLGFLCALAGVFVMLKVENFSISEQTVLGDFLILINSILYAFYLAFSKKFVEQYDHFWITTYLFVFGAIGLTAMAIPDYQVYEWPIPPFEVLFAFAYAIVGGTLLTYYLTTWILAYRSSSQVGLFIYIQPIVTAALALIIWGNVPTIRTYLGAAFIFLGLFFTLDFHKKNALKKAVQ